MRIRRKHFEFLEVMAVMLGSSFSLLACAFQIVDDQFMAYSMVSSCALSFALAYGLRIIIPRIRK